MTAGIKDQGRQTLSQVAFGQITGARCHLTHPQDLATGKHSSAPLPSLTVDTTGETLF